MTEPAYWDKGSRDTAEAIRKGPPKRGPIFWIGVVLTSCIAVPAACVGIVVAAVVLVCCLPLLGWLVWTDQPDDPFCSRYDEGEP